MKKQIGDYIISAIEMKNKTQREVAEALNVAPQTMNSYIMNKRTPDMETFARIMKYLNMDANKALGIDMDKSDLIMSKEEAEVMSNFRKLDEEHKEFARFILKKMPKEKK